MRVPRVKICGIARAEDALAAIDFGADALGFLVGLRYPRADQLDVETARELVLRLPPFVNSVLVTHLDAEADVAELCRRVGAQVVQLHGEFPVAEIPALRAAFPHLKVVKAVHSEDADSVEAAREAAEHADAVLLDTREGEHIGGTGKTHDWSLSRRIRERLGDFPVILAGGLTPDNVAAGIRFVGPYGVDVNSGVQQRPGRKNPELVRRFIEAAKQASDESEAIRRAL